jgi:hypothetical protein
LSSISLKLKFNTLLFNLLGMIIDATNLMFKEIYYEKKLVNRLNDWHLK